MPVRSSRMSRASAASISAALSGGKAFLRAAARQHLIAQWDGARGMVNLHPIAIGVLDAALAPAVGPHHPLLTGQRVEELVGEDGGGTRRHVLERLVPLDRDVAAAEGLTLP